MPKVPDRSNSAQDPYLEWMIESGVVLDIFMNNGTYIEGVVESHSRYMIHFLSASLKKERWVFKSEVATLRPRKVPDGRMERRIRRERRKGHFPLANFEQPYDPDE